jgi:hypothetical protein
VACPVTSTNYEGPHYAVFSIVPLNAVYVGLSSFDTTGVLNCTSQRGYSQCLGGERTVDTCSSAPSTPVTSITNTRDLTNRLRRLGGYAEVTQQLLLACTSPSFLLLIKFQAQLSTSHLSRPNAVQKLGYHFSSLFHRILHGTS